MFNIGVILGSEKLVSERERSVFCLGVLNCIDLLFNNIVNVCLLSVKLLFSCSIFDWVLIKVLCCWEILIFEVFFFLKWIWIRFSSVLLIFMFCIVIDSCDCSEICLRRVFINNVWVFNSVLVNWYCVVLIFNWWLCCWVFCVFYMFVL